MKLNVRRLRDEDYKTISKWWKKWGWPVIPKDNLPPTGLIVEKNGTSIVSGYIYITNSTAALLEWIVSNPEYRDKDRKKAIELLIKKVESFCKDIDVKHIITLGRNKSLIETHKKLGWLVDNSPSYEIIKNI